MTVHSVVQEELKLKAIMEILVAQIKVALVNMHEANKLRLESALKTLNELGYRVSPISCGECNSDDVLVEIHECDREVEV